MNMHSPNITPRNAVAQSWIDQMFTAKTAGRGGVVRRSVLSVEREVGRAVFIAAVRQRGYHCVECGGQFIVICNLGQMQVLC